MFMQLENEIKSRFKNDRHKAGVNIIFTANWYSGHVSAMLKCHGLTLQQYNILRILRGIHPEPVSVKYIRERMLDKMSDVSRVVEKLREKQLVNRDECEADRRNVDITINKQGLSLLKKIDKEMLKIEQLFDSLTEEELLQLNMLLDKLRT
jgi:DNA-binding MarR family transcriptional regulator